MEKRVLLAIFLAFLVLYVWQSVFVKPVPKPGAAGTTAAAGAAGGRGSAGASAQPTPTDGTANGAAAGAKPSTPATPAASALVGDTAERDVRVETSDVIAVFTNRGARLKSWRLKHYLNAEREPQELVEHELSTQPLPFTLKTASETVTGTLNNALYTVSGAPPAAAAAAPVDLRFEYRDSAGVHAVKQFHLDPASYMVTFRATVSDGDRALSPAIVWGPGMGDVGEISRYTIKAEGLLYDENGKVLRLAAKDIGKQPLYEGNFKYAGVDDNYFMTAALRPGPAKILYQPVAIPPPANSKDAPRELMSYSIEPKPDTAVTFFIGPKDFDVLSAIDTDVARAINFGMFTVIVVPLLRSLKWVNGFVGNYGWAIIILTVIINVIMFPLRHKSMVSMRKMQEIQPQVKAIQDRYSKLKATDPAKQKMNTELMALYKEKGVNPASGCVPMILTFPFIFAFYALLSTAIELRGAPFIGWIHDLSAHDPYFVTPILMGISQIWQQRLAPATGMDPAQQKMMLVMPVFFTFLFLWYPSGVALYWLVNNIWAIGQQYMTNYLIGPPNVRTVRPPAERRMKRVGGGKTEAAARES
jgi:YidC/Oxa1 family membrane protein insertase